MGAEDDLAELVARLRALLRRATLGAPPPTDVHLDPSRHSLVLGEQEQALTPTEFRLLAALLAAPGTVLRRRELVRAAWPDGAQVNDNTLDQYVARLRRKLTDIGAAESLTTARGVGYRYG